MNGHFSYTLKKALAFQYSEAFKTTNDKVRQKLKGMKTLIHFNIRF